VAEGAGPFNSTAPWFGCSIGGGGSVDDDDDDDDERHAADVYIARANIRRRLGNQ